MKKSNAWKRAIKHLLGSRHPANDNRDGCCLAGPHAGPLVVVAADDHEMTRMCLHHAKTWSDSDLCHNVAATGHTNPVRVLSSWLSTENALLSS